MDDKAVQVTTVSGSNNVTLKTRTLSLKEREKLADLLEKDFNVDKSKIETQSISSTISGEMRKDAIVAVIVATPVFSPYTEPELDTVAILVSLDEYVI